MAGSPMTTKASASDVRAYLLAVVTASLGVIVFTLAFFPNNIEVPPGPAGRDTLSTSVGDSSSSSAGAKADRVVLMLVDALRTDFVWQKGTAFPFTMSRLREREAVAFTTRAHPPTVTMPRIKAMITGDIPGFLDIVANFNSKEMREDNIISRARAAGKKVSAECCCIV